MVRIISALILAVAVVTASAEEAIELADNPPDRHIVVPGDTLWGIAGKFLKNPWRWPDIWRLNKADIRNPHRIYPGDVVVLDLSSGQPQLKLAKPLKLSPTVYSEPVRSAISSIPPNVIDPFISKPLVVDEKGLETAPKLVASQEDRIMMGSGDTGFVDRIDGTEVVNWQIFRPGKPLKDPENGEIIGHEAYFLGNARLIQPGAPAVIRITQAKEEIAQGDRLVPATHSNLIAYVPRKPEVAISGRVMAMYGGVHEGGPLSVVSINRGSNDGLELGHVVALHRKRSSDGYDEDNRRITTQLPEERYALAFVFRTFERVSYALVMESSKPVIVNDAVHNP